MREFTLVMTAVLLAAIGCGPSKPKATKPTERAGGVISQIHDRVDELKVMEMMKDLHLHILQEESGVRRPRRVP